MKFMIEHEFKNTSKSVEIDQINLNYDVGRIEVETGTLFDFL